MLKVITIRFAVSFVAYINQLVAALYMIEGDYADYVMLWTAAGLLSMFVLKGAPTILTRECAKNKNVDVYLGRVFKRLILVSAVSLLAYSFFTQYVEFVDFNLFYMALFYFFVMSLAEMIGAVLRGIGYLNFNLLAQLIGNFMALLFMFLFKEDLNARDVLVYLSLGLLIVFLLSLYVAIKKRPKTGEIAVNLLEAPLLWVALLSHLFMSADRFVIPNVGELNLSEYYLKIVVLVGRPFQVLSVTLEQYLLPYFSRNISDLKYLRVKSVSRGLIFGSVLMLFVAISLIYLKCSMDKVLFILVFATYMLYPVYSLMGARLWSVTDETFTEIYIKMILVIGGISASLMLIFVELLRSVLVVALVMLFFQLGRSILMLRLNERLQRELV